METWLSHYTCQFPQNARMFLKLKVTSYVFQIILVFQNVMYLLDTLFFSILLLVLANKL